MSHFLITSAISMAVLLGLYHLLLESEKMHRFNRFYLLASVIISLLLPFLAIEVYTEVVAEPMPAFENLPYAPTVATGPVIEETNYLPYIVSGIYLMGAIIFVVRFTVNIARMMVKVRRSETLPYKNARLVLVEEQILPHTFLNYIFINKEEYCRRAIEPELFTHELVHVRQKHTMDILFIEILKAVLWFSPLFHFYKKAIQLNHEFLADEAVVAEADVAAYQILLLQKAHPATLYPLASSLNFSVTKKRFTMMTKATTKSKAFLLKISAVPVIAGLIALLCIETVAQEKTAKEQQPSAAAQTQSDNDDEKRDRYYAGVHVKIVDEYNDVYIDKPYEELTADEKRMYLPLVTSFKKKSPSQAEFNSWKDKNKFALWLDDKNIDNKVLGAMKPTDVVSYSGSSVFKNARTKKHPQPYQFQLYTQTYFEKRLKPMAEKFQGKVYEMHVYKDKKPVMNSTPAALTAMKILDGKGEKVAVPGAVQEKSGSWEDVEFYLKQDVPYSPADLDEQPEFPGGLQALYNLIAKIFRVPDIDGNHTLIIHTSFIIEKDGSVSDIKILKDPGHGQGVEAERVLTLVTEKWKPGTKNKKAVRTLFTLPISINIRE
ncbi:M56 family metallopeptidase [uncultured Flavobacterium sp.]|uniref:M56 family metallopeptidase n=1 Tax=uncultured Flavobacterium sp. TaxID=165435 RepID=UPI0025CDBB10|nr:M56 family metallopeptidase [uncultured Flavobacterium sp.]